MILQKEERNKACEVLIDYKFAYCCSKCRVIYGSDLIDNIGLCPNCQSKLKNKRGK